MITFSRLGKMGRIGNQLFQIASTIGISKKNNKSFSFPNWQYSKYFKLKYEKNEGDNQCVTIKENQFCYTDFNLTSNSNYDLYGYLQSFRYFENINIYDYLDFEEIFYEPIFKSFDFENSISIHFRRNDYLKLSHIYENLDINYYHNCLNMAKDIFETIYVFSDDIDWCKLNFNYSGKKIIFIEGNSDIEDLMIMSKCKNNIISNSTFSWWAAFLNKNENKKIYCPENWFKLPNNEIVNFKCEDLIPENWIKIKI